MNKEVFAWSLICLIACKMSVWLCILIPIMSQHWIEKGQFKNRCSIVSSTTVRQTEAAFLFCLANFLCSTCLSLVAKKRPCVSVYNSYSKAKKIVVCGTWSRWLSFLYILDTKKVPQIVFQMSFWSTMCSPFFKSSNIWNCWKASAERGRLNSAKACCWENHFATVRFWFLAKEYNSGRAVFRSWSFQLSNQRMQDLPFCTLTVATFL